MTFQETNIDRVTRAFNLCPTQAMYELLQRAYTTEFLTESDMLLIEAVETGKVVSIGRQNGHSNRPTRRNTVGGYQRVL